MILMKNINLTPIAQRIGYYLNSPKHLAGLALSASLLLVAGVAYSTGSSQPEDDCRNAAYGYDKLNEEIQKQNKYAVQLMYESMNINTSDKYDAGGGNQCLKLIRLTTIDLSKGMPDDLGFNAMLDVVIKTLRDVAVKQACDLASGTLNDMIGKYNNIITSMNGTYDLNGAAKDMMKDVLNQATQQMTSDLQKRASDWKTNAGNIQIISDADDAINRAKDAVKNATQNKSTYCASTQDTSDKLGNMAGSSNNKWTAMYYLYGKACMNTQSLGCSDGLYYQREYWCADVDVQDCQRPHRDAPEVCTTTTQTRDSSQCQSIKQKIAIQEQILRDSTSQTDSLKDAATDSVNNTACQAAIDSLTAGK